MKIVIPMAGRGERFLRAGYSDPKPLVKVDGRPMIEHVIEMFPGTRSFVFICNREHLENSPLEAILRRAAPGAQIVSIEPHKQGPVYSVYQAMGTFGEEEEVIVNYCDFGVSWDFDDFLRNVRERRADGAMSAYRGFHPHSLGPNFYAYVRHADNWMLEIQEKKSFTQDRMNEYASSGTYYFARGSLVKKYFPLLIEENQHVGGEYFVSIIYNLMRQHGYRTYIYELTRFLQWGTPEDLEEYHYWSDSFRRMAFGLSSPSRCPAETYNLMLMAGQGARFQAEGYDAPKPLVPVEGAPMVVRAVRSLPEARRWGFVGQKEHFDRFPLREALEAEVGEFDLKLLEQLTEGQACTALLAQDMFDREKPLLIAACDNGVIYDRERYGCLAGDESVDVLVWTFRNHASLERNPSAFGWVEVDGHRAVRVSVKVPVSRNPRRDHAIVGTFFFRRGLDFIDAVNAMMRTNSRVRGEFYIDEAINFAIAAGKSVCVFEVDKYLGWGTPNDLRTYEYWSEHFKKTRQSDAPRGGGTL